MQSLRKTTTISFQNSFANSRYNFTPSKHTHAKRIFRSNARSEVQENEGQLSTEPTPTTTAAKEEPRFRIGFTKSNELFVGRMAMLGVASSIIGEILTGKGALGQLGLETGLPVFELDGTILSVVAFNLTAALLPTKGRFVPDEVPPKVLADGDANPVFEWRRFFGVRGFGFTKQNELFIGRVAQLGFAISLIGEGITGQGILAQFDFETGLPLSETEPLLIVFILFTLFAAINEGTGKFVDEDDYE